MIFAGPSQTSTNVNIPASKQTKKKRLVEGLRSIGKNTGGIKLPRLFFSVPSLKATPEKNPCLQTLSDAVSAHIDQPNLYL